MSIEYFLRVIRVEGIQCSNFFDGEKPKLYVQARLGDITQETGEIQDTNGSWNDILILPKADTSKNLSIKLFQKLWFRHNVCIGSGNIQLDELSAKWTDGSAPLELTPGDKDVGSPTLFVHLLNPSNMLSDIENDVEDASQAVLKLGHTFGAEQGESALSGREDLYKSLWHITEKLSVVSDFMDELAKINPYLNAAWQLTSAVSKAIKHQKETDVRLTELVHAMQGAYDFVKDVQALPDKAQRLQHTIEVLLRLTAKCCRFVLNYTRRDFLGRIFRRSRPKVDEYTAQFTALKQALDSNIGLHTAVVSTWMSEKIDNISEKVNLMDLREVLKPWPMDMFSRRTCLQGTREEVLIEIMDWIQSDTKQNVLWLRGVAGSGKSTIASTIVERCCEESLLGAFLIFNRDTTTAELRSSIFRTIACQLAESNPSIAKNVEDAVKQNAHISKVSAELQFKELLTKPLNASRDEVKSPVVIILEALDEYGSVEDRRSILELKQSFADLPSNFRFILTSRPEADIVTALSHRQDSVYELALDSGSEDNLRDVRRYIDHDMGLVLLDSGLDKPGDWEMCMRQLAKASEGLFIWASTAIRLVKENPSPLEKLEDVVRNSHSLKGLNRLYNSVLRHSAAVLGDDPLSITRFSRIFSLVLQSKEPLTDDMIDGMLGFSPRNPSRLIFSKLQSVLVFKGEPIRFLHKSFADYLSQTPCPSPCSTHQNPSYCLSGPWFIDTSTQKSFIAMQVFEIMKNNLHFNMCKLESSFELNKNVPDLKERVKDNISPHLEYACMYWAEHLCDVPYSRKLGEELGFFAHNRLLYWLEVLCLLGESELLGLSKWDGQTDCKALTDSATWLEMYNGEISSFLRDASRLASKFAQSITESTPHIYVSMIPLMKEDSEVAAHYARHSTSMVQIDRIWTRQSPKCSKYFDDYLSSVECVAISPNGKYIASGSRNETIGVWSIESGRIICRPVKGHDNTVSCISFSPDSRHIVSGSRDKTIRIWDTVSGALLSGPFQGHSGSVTPVAFSPSGTLVASGSADKTIKVWDIKSGRTVHVLEGHTSAVTSVAFTPDGSRIVSGSYDATIRVWKTETDDAIGKPFTVHGGSISSIAVSLNDTHIASGSDDGKVRVWDIESGKVVFEPSWRLWKITSVAFSPDSKWVMSGSKCGTIVVHDMESGNVVCGPLTDHMRGVLSVAFTPDRQHIICSHKYRRVQIWDVSIREADQGPFVCCHIGKIRSAAYSSDGSRIASGSDDGTIVVWDTTTCKPVCGLYEHNDAVNSIAFSPDGRRLVSGSDDSTVIIWDIDNKSIGVGPLTEHMCSVSSVDFSPFGTRVVSGSADDSIIIWDAGTGEILCKTGYNSTEEDLESRYSDYNFIVRIGAVRFSPDGKLIASASWDNDVTLWDAETGEIVAGPFEVDKAGYAWRTPLAFSPDGKCIASRSALDGIIVRDVETGHIVCGPLEGRGDEILSIAYSPDGQRIVSGSGTWGNGYTRGDVLIWNAEDGTFICQYYNAHSTEVLCIATAPNGSHVISCSEDGKIRIWDVSDQEVSSATTTSDPGDTPPLPSVTASQSSCGAVLAKAEDQVFANWSINENGWILGPKGERLLWVPLDIQCKLWHPQTTGFINCDGSIKLGFKGAALGRRWQGCFNPTIEEITYSENEAAIVDPDAGTRVASGQDQGISGSRGFASLHEWTEVSNEDVHDEGSSKGTKRRRLQ